MPSFWCLFKYMQIGLEALESGMKEVLLVISIHVIFNGLVHFEFYWIILASFVLLIVLKLAAALVFFSQIELPLVVKRTLLGFKIFFL